MEESNLNLIHLKKSPSLIWGLVKLGYGKRNNAFTIERIELMDHLQVVE